MNGVAWCRGAAVTADGAFHGRRVHAGLGYGDMNGEIRMGAGAGVIGSVIRRADMIRRTIDDASIVIDGLIGLAGMRAG